MNAILTDLTGNVLMTLKMVNGLHRLNKRRLTLTNNVISTRDVIVIVSLHSSIKLMKGFFNTVLVYMYSPFTV